MTSARASLLLLSDPTYPARGRRYGDEDIRLASQLRETFDVAMCHPVDAVALMDHFDLILLRNTGPALDHWDDYQAFRTHAAATGARVFNELTGRADMVGKQYLPELFDAGYPVIPTVLYPARLNRLPEAPTYVAKPLLGADSNGMRFLAAADMARFNEPDMIIQPLVELDYEVSFYFINDTFHYALYAPDRARRWELQPYEPSDTDLDFAHRFIHWNDIRHGIQRVDAGRTPDGTLHLMELEDLNPYLSLGLLPQPTQERFITHLTTALKALL